MTEHLDFATLNDLADGAITDAAQRAAAERHLSVCAACNAQLRELRGLLDDAHELPPSIEPPTGLWDDVREAIGPRGIPLQLELKTRIAWWRRPSTWVLAAAALVLVVSSSAITASVVRRNAIAVARESTVAAANESRATALPAALALVEAGYDDTARQLEATLTLQRQRLSPKTIATVERSLAVIDSAIDEARRALLEDPSNRALVDIFAANYERKLDFLRRATELTSSL